MTNTDVILNAAKEIVGRGGGLPLIVDYEIYEFFGETVSIVEMTSTVGPRVIIESQLGERYEVELPQLGLKRARGAK